MEDVPEEEVALVGDEVEDADADVANGGDDFDFEDFNGAEFDAEDFDDEEF